MSASRKSPLLATAVALGLIVATTIVIHSRSNKKSAGQRERSAGAPNTANTAAAADKLRSEMETEEARNAAPLSLAPAPAGSKALVVCLEGSEEAAVAQQWAGESRGAGANVSACPASFLGSLLSKADHAGAYDSIVVETAGAGVEGAVLGQVVKLLKPGGKVHVASSQGAGGDDAGDALATKKRALTFAGFLKVAPCPEDGRVLSGERPTWEAGASAPVRLSFSKPSAAATVGNGNGSTAAAAPAAAKNGSQNGSQNGNGSAAGKTWKLALDDDEDGEGSGGGVFGAGGGDEEDDDLVDEDALLESSAPVKRVSEADGDGGCATKRRACKDCSCGRAEMEMSEKAPPPLAAVSVGNVDEIVTSACGNCSKGDAFRCGGCPFLGKPAFEKGQEKTIMLADLDAQQDD